MAHIEPRNSLRETAALWHEIARHENASADSRVGLNTWLSESPEHAAAYQAIEVTWSTLQRTAQDPRVLELRHEAARRLMSKPSISRSPLRWAAAAAIVLSLGAALWILIPHAGFELSPLAWLKGDTRNLTAHSYATKTGDRLSIALADGSHVTLNTETQIDVTFTKTSRTVRLSRGQALFEVAKDKSRPFVVQTARRRLVAVGTAFDVRLDGQQVKVTMLEGTVRAEGTGTDLKLKTTVTAGEQLIATAQFEDQVLHINPERETSWRHGQVIFENTRLGDAIGELNRYSVRHIVLSDSKLADLRISGTFDTGGTSALVEAVTAYFPIEIDHVDERNVTLKARR